MTALEMSLPSADASIEDLLKRCVEVKASDLHLSCGYHPKARIDGDLKDLDSSFIISAGWMMDNLSRIMDKEQLKTYDDEMELDFSFGLEDFGRFRVNCYIQKETPAAVFRLIPDRIRSAEELGLPLSLLDLTKRPAGLIIVTGETGAGKSSTLAAMIEDRNQCYPHHIMTIEDPIEFVYKGKMSLINQREIGRDTKGFHEALRRVLRQDPDVILIGELRDAETIAIALTAAETGHLVFATLHTQSAAKSINRIIDTFPSTQQNQIRSQLADSLQAVISQVLLKKIGGGRVAATEILVRNNAIASQIRSGKTSGIQDAIQSGRDLGMHTLDQDLKRLVTEGLVSKEEAMNHVENVKSLDGIY